jgi:hypothetical protein
MSPRRSSLTLLLATALAACSGRQLDLDEQTAPPTDPSGSSSDYGVPDANPSWSCVASQNAAPIGPPVPIDVTAPYAVVVQDYTHEVLPPGLDIRVCIITDFECVQPLATETTVLDPERQLMGVRLPIGFEGYLRLSAPGYLQTEYYFLGPMFGVPGWSDEIPPRRIRMWRQQTQVEIVQQLGLDVSPEMGTLMLAVSDCEGHPAAGVQLELPSANSGLAWVETDDLITASIPPPSTDESGVAGFFRVNPGAVPVEASLPCPGPYGAFENQACAGPAVRFGRAALIVRANTVSLAEIRPYYGHGL